MDTVWPVVATVGGIVVGNLILYGIRGNKKVSDETFKLFVDEVRTNFTMINSRLSKIEEVLSTKGVACRLYQKDKES